MYGTTLQATQPGLSSVMLHCTFIVLISVMHYGWYPQICLFYRFTLQLYHCVKPSYVEGFIFKPCIIESLKCIKINIIIHLPSSISTCHPGSTVINLPMEGSWILLCLLYSVVVISHITHPLENSHYASVRMIVKKANNILVLLRK